MVQSTKYLNRFTTKIIDLSKSDDYNTACKEWIVIKVFDRGYSYSENYTDLSKVEWDNILSNLPVIKNECACGQKNLVFISSIYNKLNGKYCTVGSSCIYKRFDHNKLGARMKQMFRIMKSEKRAKLQEEKRNEKIKLAKLQAAKRQAEYDEEKRLTDMPRETLIVPDTDYGDFYLSAVNNSVFKFDIYENIDTQFGVFRYTIDINHNKRAELLMKLFPGKTIASLKKYKKCYQIYTTGPLDVVYNSGKQSIEVVAYKNENDDELDLIGYDVFTTHDYETVTK